MAGRNKLMEAAKAQFQKRRELLGPILVPEWEMEEGNALEVFVKPPSMQKKQVVLNAYKEGIQTWIATTVVTYGLGRDGMPLFQPGDVEQVMTTFDPVVVERVANDINALLKPTEAAEAELGNS